MNTTSTPDILETIKGAKNRHPQVRFRCSCGRERIARATKVRKGIIRVCIRCAIADGARRGNEKRKLPALERLLREKWSTYKSNAKRKGLSFALSLSDASALFSRPCEYCGGKGGGIDRINSECGYTVENSVPCCAKCNYAKRDLTREAFLLWVKDIYEHQSIIQRNRQELLRVDEQPNGRGINSAGNDKQQVDSGSNAGGSEAL